MTKPYILFYTFDDHGFATMKPVFDLFGKDPEFDVTLLLAVNKYPKLRLGFHVTKEVRLGLQGTTFEMDTISVERKPSVIIGFRMWWPPDSHVCSSNPAKGIPMVMINHGSMFVYNEDQAYKKNLGGARVNCIWGEHDRKLWRKWNKNKKQFVVTGNPIHDQLVDYKCPDIDVSGDFALLLTSRWQRKYLDPSAEALNQIMPVVAKCHPIDPDKRYYKERYRTFTSTESLVPLIYKAKLIITNVSSALQPALFFGKPIFIHSYAMQGYHFGEFEKEFPHVFNFKRDAIWSSEMIEDAVRPTLKDYEYFGHKPDGKNAQRVMDVIKRYV